jgi:iron complex transport system substrate-binding protein
MKILTNRPSKAAGQVLFGSEGRLSEMKFSKICIFIIWSSICFSSGYVFAEAAGKNPITVTDFRGKQLTFQRPVKRIVCLIESALSGLYMLNEEKRVVGVSRNVYDKSLFSYYGRMDERIRNKAIPSPGNWDFVNIETVISLKPDLVILWAQQTESISAIEERGIPVFGVFIQQKEDVYREMTALGKLTGNQVRGEELIKFTQNEILRFKERVGDILPSRRPGVYYMWAQGNLETSGGSSTVNDLINLAGGRNVCASIPEEHLVVNLERVIGWNPDVIVMWYNERKDPSDVIKDRQWQKIKAVKERRVHELPEIFLCDLWTLKFQYAVKMVSKWCHPQLFKGIDLEKEKEKMLRTLYGKKFLGD